MIELWRFISRLCFGRDLAGRREVWVLVLYSTLLCGKENFEITFSLGLEVMVFSIERG